MFFVLLVIMLQRTASQWQRKSLTYAYGFEGIGHQLGNPIFEMTSSYPELSQHYGLLSGLVYTLPYSIAGLYAGQLADKVNRKTMLAVMIFLCGLSQSVTGLVNSFWVFVLMRMLHGAANSATVPLSYSLVTDYVRPENRTFVNSILNSGAYIGIALSSLTILMIDQIGWRSSFNIMGVIGCVIGIVSMFIKEPERGKYARKVPKVEVDQKD